MDIRNVRVIRPRNANKMLTTIDYSARVLSCTVLCTLFVSRLQKKWIKASFRNLKYLKISNKRQKDSEFGYGTVNRNHHHNHI